ncbi:hypothetical protein [Paraburkholderia sp.]|uniref:hypothetical protein n=1 Tax=Paraburkholderia sp. TaxID=1926495 RepID=UPI003D6FE715
MIEDSLLGGPEYPLAKGGIVPDRAAAGVRAADVAALSDRTQKIRSFAILTPL